MNRHEDDEWRWAVVDLTEAVWSLYENPSTYLDVHGSGAIA